jgi:DNA-binding MarR family transcriptional regulator
MESRRAELGAILLRIFNKFLENQKLARHYGLEERLYPAEMHLLALIGSRPGAGVTELAELGGVTKGAISQIAQKLVKKRLITKDRDPDNGTRVIFQLTNKGKVAFYSHARMHDEVDRELFDYVEQLKPTQFRTIQRFLTLVEDGIDKRSET